MKYLIAIFSLLIAINACAATKQVKNPGELAFQVIDTQLLFNKNNIKEAKVGETKDGRAFVEIKLDQKAAEKLKFITAKNTGKEAVVVWNGKEVSMATIRTPIGPEFVLMGFTLQEAQTFVAALKMQQNPGV